jgi:hypothetical protein
MMDSEGQWEYVVDISHQAKRRKEEKPKPEEHDGMPQN